MNTWQILLGDVRETLATLPGGSVQCCVTSPPYWGLRDYGTEGQLGLESTPDAYVANMVAVFREVWRVLRDDGTLWLNLGSSYASAPVGTFKHKDLVSIPAMVAEALRAPYYTGTIRNELDRVWLAAMLDAEGCLFIHKRKAGQHNGQGYYRQNDNYGLGVEIANTSLAVVERVMALVGKGSICSQGPNENARRKQTLYRWNLRTTESRDFVQEVYPYLVAKRQQARILYGCPSSGERAAAAHAGLMSLHRTGESGVDFPEIPTMLRPGYYLRSDIIWNKCNPMPESVTDRPTKAHEYLFLLTKSARYYYDAFAIKEASEDKHGNRTIDAGFKTTWRQSTSGATATGRLADDGGKQYGCPPSGRNKRSVWTVATQPYSGAHFATFPEALIEPCILAGTSEHGQCSVCGAPWTRVVEVGDPDLDHQRACGGDDAGEYHGTATKAYEGTGAQDPSAVKARILAGMRAKATTGWVPSCECGGEVVPQIVLDLFNGSGTTGAVAIRHRRNYIGCELNPEYVALARSRIGSVSPLFARENIEIPRG